MAKRRFEILLPAEFNDGRLVADACPQCVPESPAEVVDTFGASTFRPDAALGTWAADGRRYDDRLSAMIVDIDDTAAHRAGICHLEAHLLQRNGPAVSVSALPPPTTAGQARVSWVISRRRPSAASRPNMKISVSMTAPLRMTAVRT